MNRWDIYKPIIITPPAIGDGWRDECMAIAEVINRFGCMVHLRKKSCKDSAVEAYVEYLLSIAPSNRLVMHDYHQLSVRYALGGVHLSYHLLDQILPFISEHPNIRYSISCHTFSEVVAVEQKGLFDYQFLSPIFDSISKKGYSSNFDHAQLREKFAKLSGRYTHIVALGGIDRCTVAEAMNIGFDSVALLGAIWQDGVDKMVDNYSNIYSVWEK